MKICSKPCKGVFVGAFRFTEMLKVKYVIELTPININSSCR